MHTRQLLFVSAAFVATALAHGIHAPPGDKPVIDVNADWATQHMAEEHHITDFDANSFFVLHDYDNDGYWKPAEIERTYGLMDESNAGITPQHRDQITAKVLSLFDHNVDGRISREEYVQGIDAGKALPNMGTGPGHHGDDEYEYEIHHWEKYHDENTKLEDLTHPEDIEHFRKHEEMEAEQERLEMLARQPIVLDNVPQMFRRAS